MIDRFPDSITRKVEFASKYQFKDHISVSTIYKWLANFKEDEIPMAIKLLEHLEYFSSTDLSAILKSHLEPYLSTENNDETRLHFLPIGKPGKSGFVILYLIKNLFKESIKQKGFPTPRYYSKAAEIDIKTLGEKDIVFFVDDIIGSGETFLSNVCTKEQKEKLRINPHPLKNEDDVQLCLPDRKFKVAILTCIIMDRGRKNISKVFPHIRIFGETRHRIFDKAVSPFHSYHTIINTREIAYEHGKKLVNDPHNALGYGNSQAMIIFEHATPNNTLPIIWKSAAQDDFKWFPLKARSHRERILYAIDDRQYNTRWLISLSTLFGVEPEDLKGSNLVSPENYDLALVLRLIRIGLSDLEIAITMGLPLNKFTTIKDKGRDRGFWDSNLKLTKFAEQSIAEIEKYLSLFPTLDDISEPYDDRDILYIPMTFEGIS